MMGFILIFEFCFDNICIDAVEQFLRTSDLKHVLDDAVECLFDLFYNVLYLVFILKIDGPVNLESFNILELLFEKDFSHLAEYFHGFIVVDDRIKEDVHSIVVDLNTNLEGFFQLVFVDQEVADVLVPLVDPASVYRVLCYEEELLLLGVEIATNHCVVEDLNEPTAIVSDVTLVYHFFRDELFVEHLMPAVIIDPYSETSECVFAV